jgi:hypothetical protein
MCSTTLNMIDDVFAFLERVPIDALYRRHPAEFTVEARLSIALVPNRSEHRLDPDRRATSDVLGARADGTTNITYR